MNLPSVNIKQLLEAGVHLGHKTFRWNPKMSKFIFGSKDSIHIIDLVQTLEMTKSALQEIHKCVASGGKILFVSTKKQASDAISTLAKDTGQYYVSHRWLGGMLTNWETVSNSLNSLNSLNKKINNQNLKLKKKEILQMNRQIEKIEKYLGGLKEMGTVPQAIFVVDVNKDAIAVSEANKLKIPVIAILDTNSSPQGIDYPIPGNDDSRKSIELICSLISKSMLKNKKKNDFKEKTKKSTIEIPTKKEVKKKLNKEKKK